MWSHVLHRVPVLPLSLLHKVLTYLYAEHHRTRPATWMSIHAKTQDRDVVSGMFALEEKTVVAWPRSTCHRIIAHPNKTSSVARPKEYLPDGFGYSKYISVPVL